MKGIVGLRRTSVVAAAGVEVFLSSSGGDGPGSEVAVSGSH